MPSSFGVDVVEDPLRVVGAVVVTDAGMVATHDEVGAAVVLADDRVKDSLTRAGVMHLAGVDPEHHVVRVVVVLHQDLVALHPHVSGDVALLGLADQRMDVEAVADLERGLRQVLVRPVDRVTGLERDDALPAPVGECLLRLLGRLVALHERFLVIGQSRRPRSGRRGSDCPPRGWPRRPGARCRSSDRPSRPRARRPFRRSPRR